MKRTIVTALVVAGFTIGLAAQGGGGRQGGAAAPNETLSQSFRESHGRDVAYQTSLPGFKIFDNLYHVGVGTVSTWLIPTTAGLIMIDSSQEPYVDHVLDNIRNLGFDPKDVKYVLIVHGHLDHFGGAARIKELSGARVGMTEADWKMVDDYAAQQRANPPSVAPVQRAPQRDARDLVLKDGDVVTLGRTSLKVFVTPGHTPGSASFEFTAYDSGKPHKAFMFGGPEPRDGVEGGRKFLASVNRVAQMEPDVEVGLLIHSWLAMSTYPNGGTFERMVRLQARRPGEPNPFVDPASWQQWLVRLKTVADKYIADETAKAGRPTASTQAPLRPAAPARPPIYPTREQFAASAQAQRLVAAAQQLAGNDLTAEFENTCSFTGPERAALKRERLGLPPMKDYTVEPTKIKDYALKMGADAMLNAHPGIYQDTLADMETIRKTPNGPNPLLYGKQRAERYWKIMGDCATARVVALEQAGTK